MSTNGVFRELEEQRNFALARAAQYAGQLEDAMKAMAAKDQRIAELEQRADPDPDDADEPTG